MKPIIESPEPLLVEVIDGRYECYGEPTNQKHAFLTGYLMGMGGINESVVPGMYLFNVEQVGESLIASLDFAP